MSRRPPGRHRVPSPSACACGSPHCRRGRPRLRGVAAALPLLLGATAFLAAAGILPSNTTGNEAVPALPTAPAPTAEPHPTRLPTPGVSQATPAPHSSPAPAGTAPGTSPITTQIRQQEIAAEAVAERLEEARVDLHAMTNEQTAASTQLDQATQNLTAAQTAFATWTRDSYITAATRPDGLAADPRNNMFGHPAPAAGAPLATLRTAQTRHQQATDELTRATAATTRVQENLTNLTADLDRRSK